MDFSRLQKIRHDRSLTTMIILLIMAGCGGSKQSTDDFITVDVTKSYPQKELILQDFMDVEYFPLETTDNFVCQGVVRAINKDFLIITNSNQINDGDIFVFDRNGKGLTKINRKGQGNEEYTSAVHVTLLDEENNEIFINEPNRIMVYDLTGKFLRSFPKNEGTDFSFLHNYDQEHLICREITNVTDEKSTESQPFAIISKKDGSIVNGVRIQFKKGINALFTINFFGASASIFLSSQFNSIIPFHDSWILTELSSDTIFRLLPDLGMIPFITRTPSVHSMTQEIFLFPILITDRFYFMETFKKEVDMESIPIIESFPRQKIVFDRQTNTIFECAVYNNDYATEKIVNLSNANINNEIAFCQKIESFELVEAYKKGELKGRLKEIASGLDAEDNPVIMLVKHKK